ncbi:pseudouridine synthase [Aequorivita marina]|uniref:pseudouridine synthase n=1 Tax=Aequorivita marina TaxID=3073654 RepID=UPI0028765B15|nr:pseudouridine synthase [Aequorivita sp. S2608]MDS1298508.1 S4 domain-containing protein [Aequorivita sp. S2608]
MSRQDKKSSGKASGRGSNNQRNRSNARGNAPSKPGSRSKKTGGQRDSTNKPKLKFDKNGKEIGRREKPVKQSKSKNPADGIRLNKYISNSGVCSRREADTFIATGLVSVNGKIINEMGYKVQLSDDVRFDGRRINPEPNTYVLLNKPKGFATTDSNAKGMTVMDLVANATTAKIKPFGRLGRNATGLLLFTNDEEFVQKFGKKGISRLFHLELNKNLKPEHLKKIQEGLTVEGKAIMVEEVSYVDNAPKNEVGLKIKHTGNSVIRTIFEHLGYDVVRVDCVGLGPLTKKDLPRGRWRTLTKKELNAFNML